MYPDRNQIFLIGLHQGGSRLVSSGLHRIESVISSRGIKREAHVGFARFVSSQSGDDYLPSTSLRNANLIKLMPQGEY